MSVEVGRAGGVATVTLARPEKLNAVTDEMWRDLEAAFVEVDSRSDDRVMVLTGAGDAFCAGSDVTGLLTGPEPLPDRIRSMNRALSALRRMSIPTVCRVDGVAAGAGANLALLCDFVLATPRSRFVQIFIRRGLSLDSGASWLLPRLVGQRRAVELGLLGDPVDANDAERIGLITRAVPAEELDEAVRGLAERLSGLPAEAAAGTKSLLRDSWDTGFDDALEAETVNQSRVIESPAAREAIGGFASRRRDPPST